MMNVRRLLLAVLAGCALLAAHGSEGLAVGGRLVSETGQPLKAGTYRLEAAFATNATAAAFLTSAVTVTTDAAGTYVATLPVSVAALAEKGESVWVRQTFSTSAGVSVATLPAQRLGYAPYALQADEAAYLTETNGAYAVRSLVVSNVLQGATLVVTNRLVTSGVLAVREIADEQAVAATRRVDLLTVGSLGTRMSERVSRGTVVGLWGEELKVMDLSAESDGLLELTLKTEDAKGLFAFLRRKVKDGFEETMCEIIIGEIVGATRRVLTVPVRSGDVLALTASCGEAGRVTATCDFIYFGTTNGGSSPGGEKK